MQAIKLKARITEQATLEWTEQPSELPPGEVEVILLYEQNKQNDTKPMPIEYPLPKTNRKNRRISEDTAPTIEWSNKSEQIYWINRAFETMGIEDKTVGIEELHRQMREAGLEENEISRDLIAMRDE